MLYIEHLFDGTEDTIRSSHCLVAKDGTVLANAIAKLREVYTRWDGSDPFWFVENDISAHEVDLVIENKEYEGKMRNEVAWVNAPGKVSRALPPSSDKKSIMAKYGSKFRAVAGTASRTAAPKAQETPPQTATANPAPTPPPTPPQQPIATSSLNEAWDLFDSHANVWPRERQEDEWFMLVDAVGKPQGKNQSTLDPEDWGKVLAAVKEKFGIA